MDIIEDGERLASAWQWLSAQERAEIEWQIEWELLMAQTEDGRSRRYYRSRFSRPTLLTLLAWAALLSALLLR